MSVRDDEKNPDHPATQGLRGQWHTVAAILVLRLVEREIRKQGPNAGVIDLKITEADVADFQRKCPPGTTLVADEQPDGLHLRIVSAEMAKRLLEKDLARGRKASFE